MLRTFRYVFATYLWSSLAILAAVAWYANAPTVYEVVALDDFDEGEESDAAPIVVVAVSEPQPDTLQSMRFNVHMGLEEARADFASKAVSFTETEQPPQVVLKSGMQLASLPPVIVNAPKPPVPKPEVWTATLEQRKSSIRGYFANNCPKLIPLEKLQSAETLRQADVQIAAAKNMRVVMGGIFSQLRQHPNVVWTFCPTPFYEKLFAKR